MNRAAEILLSLIRNTFDGSPKECSLDNVSIDDWQQIIDLSFEQGVDAISVDGYHKWLDSGEVGNCLLETDESLEDLKFEWFGSVLQTEQDYTEHTAVLRQIVTLSDREGIKLLLLKGIGLSKYYTAPNHRPCGDIDIYTYGQDEKVNEIVGKLGFKVNLDSEKHAVFQFKGISIENHRMYLDSYQTENEAKVQEYLCTLFDDVLSEDGYYTPSPLKYYFFLLCHMSRHFSEYECITLRHLLDWGLFLDGEKDNLNTDLIREKLHEFNLEQCNDIFTSLAQDVIGRDLSQFIISEVSPSVKQRFLDEILKTKHRNIPTNFFHRIAHKLKILLGNQWKFKYLGITFRERILWSIKAHLKGIAAV